MNTRHIVLLLPLLIVTAGCGSSSAPPRPNGVEVSGKIVLANGSPLTGGTLVLRPTNGLHGATATIQSDGRFKLANAAGENQVVPGKYQVFVTFSDPAHARLRTAVPSKYQNTEDVDSDVTVDIQQATNDLVIRLLN